MTRRHYFPDSSCCSCMLKYCNSVTGHWMSILVLLEYFVQHPCKTRYQPRIPHTKSRDYFPRYQCQTIYCFALALSSMRGSRCCFLLILLFCFLVINVFHRGWYRPPSRSNWTDCFSMGSIPVFRRETMPVIIIQVRVSRSPEHTTAPSLDPAKSILSNAV